MFFLLVISFLIHDFFPVTGTLILWQEISSFDGKFHPVKAYFCDRKYHPVAGNSFLWRQISYCDSEYLTITGIVFMWQEISSCDRKFLSAITNLFLWHKIPYCKRKFLHLLLISFYFSFSRTHLNFFQQSVVTFAKISCEAQRFCGIQDPRFPVKISLWWLGGGTVLKFQ